MESLRSESHTPRFHLFNRSIIGYVPADLTVHPPPRTAEGGFIFLYRCLVFPKKCPQMKA